MKKQDYDKLPDMTPEAMEAAYRLLSMHNSELLLQLHETEKRLRAANANWLTALRGRLCDIFGKA